MDTLIQDVRYALRTLGKNPGFTATAVLSLALGIGANTAMYSLVKQVILGMLPVHEPMQIVSIAASSHREPTPGNSFSLPLLRDFQSATDLPFDGIFGYNSLGQITMVTDSGAEPVTGEIVTGNYFDVLGVRPAVGRVLKPEDDALPGSNPVVVLSFNFWNRRFGEDPSVLNKTIRINGYPCTIVGVSAAGFDGLNQGYSPDIRVPLQMKQAINVGPAMFLPGERNISWLSVYGRLKRQVSYDQAAASLMPILVNDGLARGAASATTEQAKKHWASRRMHVLPAAQGAGGYRRTWEQPLRILMATVAAVLLLACVNIAHLLLARGSARQHELRVREAVGASRSRLVRHLLTESLLLGFLGGIAGLAFALAFGRAMLQLVIQDPAHSTLTVIPDLSMLTFNFAVALVAAVAFGLAPALRISRSEPGRQLNSARLDCPGRMLGRRLLISAQVAISLVLLTTAGLFVRTLVSLRTVDMGFRTDNILQVGLDPGGSPSDQIAQFYANVLRDIRSIPGVSSAALGRTPLISGDSFSSGILVEGFTPSRESNTNPNRDFVGPEYFSTLGLPLLAGREFTEHDTANAPKVAIVNDAFAKFYFRDSNPLGRRIISQSREMHAYTIVGVTKNSRYKDLREPTRRVWYVPVAQSENERIVRSLMVFVRTTVVPGSVTTGIREALKRVDPDLALFNIRTLRAQVDENVRRERLLAALSAFFGVIAALLSGTGLFGVLSWSVARRKREIGIRMAIGATPIEATWAVIGNVILFATAGIAAGTVGSILLGVLIQSLLFGVEANDPFTLAGAAAVTLLVAAIAAFLPGRAAARVHPAATLRAE